MKRLTITAAMAALALFLGACNGGGGGGGGGTGGGGGGSLPVANFSAAQTTVQVNTPLQFTDQSTGATSWEWDFQSDGSPDDYSQNPTHTYLAVGMYDVTLKVFNATGGNTMVRMAYITVTPPPPVADFTATQTTVSVGVPVQFNDASTNATSWSWDFNNDAVADSNQQNPSFAYSSAGTYTVVLTATNSAGSDVRTRTNYINVVAGGGVVDIDVDTNRNGNVENPGDDAGEDTWNTSGGAIFYCNIDDDDNNNQNDHLQSKTVGSADENDLARIFIRQMPTAPSGGSVTVNVLSGQSNFNVHQKTGGAWTSVYTSGASFTLTIAALQAADIELGIEAKNRLSSTWDGYIDLQLDVRDATSTSLGTDQVRLRCAPPLMVTNLWVAERYYIVSDPVGTDNNTAARTTISNLCSANGIAYSEVPGASYSYDRWLQDSSEPMMVLLPSSSGVRRVDSVITLNRQRPVDAWTTNILWNPDFDNIARFGSGASPSVNYGGNLECIPPHNNGTTNYPWGRIFMGGGSGTLPGTSTTVTTNMDAAYKQFFNACSLQGPFAETFSGWLAVGHIDEFLAFVPAPSTTRGWAVVLASPTLGRTILQNVQTAGGGNLPVFAGRTGWATTVNAILANTALLNYSNACQTKMDAAKNYLITNCGLTNADFVEVPVMFENVGSNYGAAYNPGVANLVSLPLANGTTLLVVPDPEGPDQPTDAWQAATTTALQALGTGSNPVQVTYVDVFFSYHDLLGEIHCGTNNVRTPPTGNWWN